VLTQEDEGKEFPVAYLSRRLVDAETRYSFIEKLCFALYYACTKCCHYLLTSSCIVTSQYDVIKYMLQKPILSGRLGKRAYALVKYDLTYEPIKAMKGQVVADFIVDHCINLDGSVCLADGKVWKLFFDGSVCSQGQDIGCVIVSPHGVEYKLSIRLEFECANNQAEYEALLTGLETLLELGVLHAEVFGDSNLVVQQIKGESQCFNGRLNEYREECLHLLNQFEKVSVGYIPREENTKANTLAQQASGYYVR
jgi:ribonuclease HI